MLQLKWGLMSDQSFNLFDLSAKSAKKKPPIKEKASEVKPKEPTSLVTPEEATKMLGQMRKMHGELTDKLSILLEKSGQDSTSFSNYFSNPTNFTPQEWERLQQKKVEIEMQILGESSQVIKQKKQRKRDNKALKQRKGKTLGARKKWLDMR